MTLATCLAPTLVGLTTSLGLLLQSPSERTEHSLSNGIALTVIHAPASPRQHFFSMLPHGLLTDAAGRTQWAHLLEHMVIRATDPEGLEADGVTMNGETSGLMLRLDTYAVPAEWRAAIQKQGRWVEEWITAATLEGEVLEREKGNIQMEETSTAHNGYTHKWADAAWAQVVRHGQDGVGLHGDVAAATVEGIREYAVAQARTAASVRLVSIGPADTAELVEAVEAAFGGLDTGVSAQRPPSVPAEQVAKAADHEATWDLPGDHYVEWYPLPDANHGDRLAGVVVAQLLMMQIMQSPLRGKAVNLMASPDLVTPEGRWLKLSANVPDGVTVEELQTAIREVIDRAGDSPRPSLDMMAGQIAMELGQGLDLTALRKQFEERGMANDFLEGNAALGLINLEWMTGATQDELVAAAGELKGEQLVGVLKESLAPENRATLVLRRGE